MRVRRGHCAVVMVEVVFVEAIASQQESKEAAHVRRYHLPSLKGWRVGAASRIGPPTLLGVDPPCFPAPPAVLQSWRLAPPSDIVKSVCGPALHATCLKSTSPLVCCRLAGGHPAARGVHHLAPRCAAALGFCRAPGPHGECHLQRRLNKSISGFLWEFAERLGPTVRRALGVVWCTMGSVLRAWTPQ